MKYLENENFNDLIKDGFTIVDFYADWCGPCKMLSPILEEINENIIKVNVDAHPDLAREYGIMSIPALLFFKDGKVVEKNIGFTDKDSIEDIIKRIK